MFQIDENFLEEVGLGSLPQDQKEAFLDHFREQLEVNVGSKLSEGLSEEQLEEFEQFMERDEQTVYGWLAKNTPDYTEDAIYQSMLKSAPQGMPPVDIAAEYASLRWLNLNRPDYREVVKQVLDELRQEIIKNRDAILGL